MAPSIIRPAIVALAAISLGACSSYGNDGYGYSRVAVGYGSSYYADPYWGWYDGYYYPGSGYYIWDRQGYRHRWSDGHRRYWQTRRGTRSVRDNWSGYSHRRLGDYHGHRAVRPQYRDQQVTRERSHDQRAEQRSGRYERRDDRRGDQRANRGNSRGRDADRRHRRSRDD